MTSARRDQETGESYRRLSVAFPVLRTRRVVEGRRRIKDRQDRLWRDRLHQVMVESGILRAPPILLLAVSGQGDENDPRPLLRCSEAASDLVPVHSGQPDVEEYHLGLELRGHVER